MTLVAAAAVAIPLVARRARPPRPMFVPPELMSAPGAFPARPLALPPSVPLAPLLAADTPDRLTMTEPADLAINVRPGERVDLRFNRPMVEGGAVGKPSGEEVIVFAPQVPGQGKWTSRSAYAFEPKAAAWAATRAVTMTLSPELRSLAGEEVTEVEPRTVVFDAGPLFLRAPRARRLLPGEPLRLLFSGKVDAAALPAEMLLYEVGGGRRMIPFSITEQARDAEGHTPVDVLLRRALEPGAHLALALAPPIAHGGSSPRVVEVELATRPRIDGIRCEPGAKSADQCTYRGPPGEVVDVEESLVLLASETLGKLPADAVVTRPALDALAVKVEDGKRLVLRGDWIPGQVYEVRVGGLVDAEGHALQRVPPLAVRSAGRAPAVEIVTGRMAFEQDARTVIPFSAIHVEEGEVRVGSVAPGLEIEAALAPERWVGLDDTRPWVTLPLHPIVPESRPNRWGHGIVDWQASAPSHASMAVVSVLADRAHARMNLRPSFVQRTDLGVDAKLLPDGALVWVTSIASARPVAGARVTVAPQRAKEGAIVDPPRGEGVTDAQGLAWIPLASSPLEEGAAVRGTTADDRAVIVVDPSKGIGPRHLGVTRGASAPPADAWLATVFTDRGICRPGETIHAKATLRGVVDGALAAPNAGDARLLLLSPGHEAPVAEAIVPLSRFGTADADFTVDPGAEPGNYRVEVRVPGQDAPAGAASFTVGEYRPPTLRVDLATATEDLLDKDPLRMEIVASHFFGPPAAGMSARWSLVREPGGAYPERWQDYAFGPSGAASRRGTIAEGSVVLDGGGRAVVEAAIALGAPLREEALFEVSVRDLSGLTTTARRRVRTYPAALEVGLRRLPEWIEHGAAIEVGTVVIAPDGTPKAGRAVEARISREGWHAYWEWSAHARRNHDEDEGGEEEDEAQPRGRFQPRRAQRIEVAHRCALTSAGAPVRCAWTPDRAGTYLVEATTKDERGRVSVASERVYVAGPDEHPDRDPPGTAITLTPAKRALDVGETAEIAFESPFPEAEALFAVEREGVIYTEQRRATSGGNVIRFPVSAAMIPNVFVSLTLVRPRTGPPGEAIDLAAPDLRVGLAEISVRPAAAPLTVKLDVAGPSAPAGSDVPVAVSVLDASGGGVPAEVALFAVDEATLRVTGYTAPDPLAGLFPRLSPAFAWEDLRRSLVSRVAQPLPSAAGGDGGTARTRPRDEQERFDPTPLWVGRLETDASGNAAATLHLPARPAQYRIMAVVVDEGARAGRAERAIVAAMPIVVRPVLPRFVTAGDRFEAAAFVHNTEDAPVDVAVTPVVDGVPREPVPLHLGPKGEARVAAWIDAAGAGDLGVRFEARSDRASVVSESRVAVAPRGRAHRSEMVGAVIGRREVEIALPEGMEGVDGALTLSVAAHPFVGFDTSLEALLASPDAGTEPTASSLIGLAAYAALDTGKRPGSAGPAELRARAASAIARLVALEMASGGFGTYSARGAPDGYLSAYALHALLAARRAGFTVPDAAIEHARDYLAGEARGSGFLDHGDGGHDDLAFALRALAEAGARDEDRIKAVFDQRERLSPYGLAQLALAMDAGDHRRPTLLQEAETRVLATAADERENPRVLRWYDGSARTLGAVLEAALALDPAAPQVTILASRLLATRSGELASWWSPHETSHALAALAAFAATTSAGPPIAPRVTVDGVPLAASAETAALAWYGVPRGRAGAGAHTLRIEVQGTAFFALATRWIAPLGPDDGVARGSEAALHRVIEDAAGKPLAPGAHVRLGDLLRVRLFMFCEHGAPPYVAVRDRLAGGLEPIDAAHETSPHESLRALLGMGADDDAMDSRGYHAAKSLGDLAHRSFLPTQAVFYLERPVTGLREITYGVRATAVGTFTLPPAELAALYAPRFEARSAASTITVDP